MTLKEYFDMCNGFDWFYDYSDDHRVWERGFKGDRELGALANIHGFKEVYMDFRYRYTRGEIPRPQLEDYEHLSS